jgi:hypothetical protein
MRYNLTKGVSKMDTPFFIPKGFCAGINTKILIVTCYLLPRVSFPDFGLQFLVNIKLRLLTSY